MDANLAQEQTPRRAYLKPITHRRRITGREGRLAPACHELGAYRRAGTSHPSLPFTLHRKRPRSTLPPCKPPTLLTGYRFPGCCWSFL